MTACLAVGKIQRQCWGGVKLTLSLLLFRLAKGMGEWQYRSEMRFFLIDRITRWEAGVCAEATKNVALSEDFFDDHFPRRPVMPGVLILEGMAQVSGLLLETSLQQKYGKSAKAVLTVLERTKFRLLVKPGDTLVYRVEMVSVNEAGGKVKALAVREGALVASTEMVFAFKYVEDPQLDEKRRRLMEIWMSNAEAPLQT
jgi:3-hydroxyacyl-[acyl-carrier-protein] dehydratase